MKSAEDIESYLLKVGVPYQRITPGVWVLTLEGQENLAVSMAGPVVAFRLKVMDLPGGGGDGDLETLFRTLLAYNTSEMVHGAFGLEGNAVVIVHALELENLDFNEFQAVIDDMTMAIAKHYAFLSKFSDPRPAGTSAPAPAV
jgi:hypothetical protein